MATTYLELTNEVLRELNEVVVTSANFNSAIGIQSFVKDALNNVYIVLFFIYRSADERGKI